MPWSSPEKRRRLMMLVITFKQYSKRLERRNTSRGLAKFLLSKAFFQSSATTVKDEFDRFDVHKLVQVCEGQRRWHLL